MEVVQRGSVKPIQVSMQDRQGGRKHITRVIHAESFAIDPGAAHCRCHSRWTGLTKATRGEPVHVMSPCPPPPQL